MKRFRILPRNTAGPILLCLNRAFGEEVIPDTLAISWCHPWREKWKQVVALTSVDSRQSNADLETTAYVYALTIFAQSHHYLPADRHPQSEACLCRSLRHYTCEIFSLYIINLKILTL